MQNDWQPPEMKHGEFTQWKWIAFEPEFIQIGKNVDIGALTCLFGHYSIIIEDDVQIGGGCLIYSLNTENNTKGQVIIKKGAKIGAHTIIFPNVEIKENEKIPAGSIVFMKKGKRVIK